MRGVTIKEITGKNTSKSQENHRQTTTDKEDKNIRNIFIAPTVEDVRAYCQERHNNVDPVTFVNFYSSKGWMVGKNKMKDWKASIRTWERNRKNKPKAIKPNPVPEESPFKKLLREEGYSI